VTDRVSLPGAAFPEEPRTFPCARCGVAVTTTSRMKKRCDACRLVHNRERGRRARRPKPGATKR